MQVSQIEESLQAQADSQQAQSMKAYMRHQFDFLGVRTPARRKTIKQLVKAEGNHLPIDWELVQALWRLPYREYQYAALDYLSLKRETLAPSDLPRLKKLAQDKAWWDTIDNLDLLIGQIVCEHPEVKQVMVDWSQSEDIWLRRIAIDHQLLRKEETDTALLETILVHNLNQTEFFINKAIGWSLRDYSKTNPDWVANFIARYGSQMAALSIREASKYL